MATKLMVAMLVAVVLVVSVVSPVFAGGTDDPLVKTLLGVRDAQVKVGKAIDKFYVRFCTKGFLAFTQDGTQAPSYCTAGVARQFVAGQLNKAGTEYTLPRGWTTNEFSSFVNWVVAQ